MSDEVEEEVHPKGFSHDERIAKVETKVHYLDRDVKALTNDIKRIEEKVDAHHRDAQGSLQNVSDELRASINEVSTNLGDTIAQVQATLRKVIWLLVGGWLAMTSMGGLVLWVLKVYGNLQGIVG